MQQALKCNSKWKKQWKFIDEIISSNKNKRWSAFSTQIGLTQWNQKFIKKISFEYKQAKKKQKKNKCKIQQTHTHTQTKCSLKHH